MKRWMGFCGVAAIALGASLAVAQDAPESLLPPGFDDPAPAPAPAPAPPPVSRPVIASPSSPNNRPSIGQSSGSQSVPNSVSRPIVQGEPSSSATSSALPDVAVDLSKIPSLKELDDLSTDELDQLLGLRPSYDMPKASRRSLAQVGVLSPAEGGVPTGSLANQPASLVRAAIQGTNGRIVSRWGHILLRKALVSRMAAPQGMAPVEFAAMRAKLLNKMGEHQAARALVQDIDTGNWDEGLIDAAVDAYFGTADVVGACPAVRLQVVKRDTPKWKMLQAICNAFAGEVNRADRDLNRAFDDEEDAEIDITLARRFAGAAGEGRQGVEVEWDGVDKLTPWRFALASAVGQEIPADLSDDAGPYYQRIWATAPMIPLGLRARGATIAAREGLLSSSATVDLMSQIYANGSVGGEAAAMASQLREAYVASGSAQRVSAMRTLWNSDNPQSNSGDYGRYVMTAYAAARLKATPELEQDAAALIASMLAAGLDKDAAVWDAVVESGSEGWAMLAVGTASAQLPISAEGIETYFDNDDSKAQRKSKLLLAGLAGLGRVAQADLVSLADDAELNLSRESKWTRNISLAAQYRNAGLVAILAGVGMQGDNWDQMTPLHLYHIVSALNQVGMSGEARMIAAEAIARS